MKSEFKPRPESKKVRTSVRPTSRYVNTEQARTTFEQGKKEQAEEHFQKAIQLYIRATIYDPNFYQAFCNMGTCYRSLRQYIQAKKAYSKSISIKGDDAISHYNLANLLRLMGDYESSIEHYSLVIALKEQQDRDIGSLYLNSLINLGICYKSKELYDEACECYDRALKIDPKDPATLFNYAMTMVSNLEHIDQVIFHEVVKEKANKAVSILRRYQQLNNGNPMVELQLLAMSAILDNSTENIKKVVEKLKEIQKTPSYPLTQYLSAVLGRCLKLTQEYEESAKQYQKSVIAFSRKKSTENKYDIALDQVIEKPKGKLTEEEGVKLIEEGNREEVQQRINELEESSPSRRVLELALEVDLAEESVEHLKKAQQIYNSYFKKLSQGGQDGMDKVSLQCHKLIGQLLYLKNQFKESIRHLEYVNTKLTSQDEKWKYSISIGNGLTAIGDWKNALGQYQNALKSQPDSYQANFNVGCCFVEEAKRGEGKNEEAIQYFQKSLKLLESDYTLQSDLRILYKADCLIMMAACKSELEINKMNAYETYLRAWNAIKDVMEESNSKFQFEETKILSFLLEWAEILEQKLGTITTKNQEKIKCKEMLLQTYLLLLENKQCPDKEAILSNCATIFSEEKQYVNGLASLMQIESLDRIPPNNMALTYLYLHEHYMATKFIFLAAEDSFDVIEQMNKEVICWIYGLEEQNQMLATKFKNKSDEAMIFRLEYGKMIIQAVTARINETATSEHYEIDKIKQIYHSIINSDSLLQYFDKSEHPKLKILEQTLSENVPKIKDHVDLNILQGLLQPSQNVQEDFKALVKRCIDSFGTEINEGVAEVLIHLFIFINRKEVTKIGTELRNLTKHHQETISLQLDRKVTVTADLLSRTFGEQYLVKKVQNLVDYLVNWQSELEVKTGTLFKCIEKCYYKSGIKRPLEYEYNFPRHFQWREDNSTLLKMAKALLQIVPIPTFTISGHNLTEAKGLIFNQLQKALHEKVKKKEEMKLTLGDHFAIMNVYGLFQSKADCLLFVKELQKDSSIKGNVDVGRDCDELVVIVSGIIRLVCHWADPNPVISILRSLQEHELPIDVQAAISLESDLMIVSESSEKAKQLISKVPLLKS